EKVPARSELSRDLVGGLVHERALVEQRPAERRAIRAGRRPGQELVDEVHAGLRIALAAGHAREHTVDAHPPQPAEVAEPVAGAVAVIGRLPGAARTPLRAGRAADMDL